MEEELKNQTESENEAEINLPTSEDRFSEIYDKISETDDPGMMIASFLTHSNAFTYALRVSNEIFNRQGRNRLTVSYDTSKLMSYSLDTDIDDILDKQLLELFVDILKTYLSDKMELPDKPRVAAGIVNRVKALIIMLVTTNQYGIIPYLTLPPYIVGQVSKLFDIIYEIKQSALDIFYQWLIDNGNFEMAEILKATGNKFWGSEGIKANVIWDRYFGDLDRAGKINKPEETYEVYKKCRSEYRKSTKNILPSKLYDIFNITEDAYRRQRLNVYDEISELFKDSESAKVIQRLIFEQ